MQVNQLAPNQFWFINDGKIVFQSYKTIVCTIENGKAQITEGQPQSTTTAKHLNRFLKLHLGIDNYKNL